ncbi:MAG: TIGR00730 family Rossman fold protein [Alphaproteobacteria bacterium]|nr:TIGR00730 family Rossman fold protein [Alphaproteobacteria bacterium]
MTGVRSVCVYCGSSLGHDHRYRETAGALGRLIGEAGIELVYGGGNIGLMGVIADAVIAAGGRVTGVIPDDLKRAELAHEELHELVVVDSMHARKRSMFERADAFIVLPGGPGTLDETIEIITWRQLRLHDKPIVILDDGDYWRPLIALFEHTIAHGFARDSFRGLFTVVGEVDAVLPTLAGLGPSHRRAKPDRL